MRNRITFFALGFIVLVHQGAFAQTHEESQSLSPAEAQSCLQSSHVNDGNFSATQQNDLVEISPQAHQFTVVVSEVGPGKLEKVFAAFLRCRQDHFKWSSKAAADTHISDASIACAKTRVDAVRLDTYSCTFQFHPSDQVRIDGPRMSANVGNTHSSPIIDVSFENTKGDTFSFSYMSGGLTAQADKISADD